MKPRFRGDSLKTKILNLFAGIGGNRTLWGDQHEITAIEHDQFVAGIYLKRFPKDNVIITDAYDYFLKNSQTFEIIWASPPCFSHSRMTKINRSKGRYPLKLPDLRLYSLILFLKHHFKGNWIVENVKSYYTPLIKPTCIRGRHYYWSNVSIPNSNHKQKIGKYYNHFGLELQIKTLKKKFSDAEIIIPFLKNNFRCLRIVNDIIEPEEGKLLLDYLLEKYQMRLIIA